jgi:formate--tetrahydrofolate ligase
MSHKTDIEIAREADKKPIQEIGEKLGIPSAHLLPYGHDKAKVGQDFINSLQDRDNGKLILVTAINPTPAGEGKTTTTVGLGDGLNAIGKNAMICIREASLGPNFGMKGGAAGGGYAQIVPMEEMNLHFTGDFHAITSAHSLLSAMIDNHIYWGNELDIDLRRVTWRRVVDMNDRALRQITASLGGVSNGFPREAGFDITVASEVMAILCLATDLADLQKRLGDMIVAYRRDRSPVFCRDIKADGAMTVLLKDAMQPNLVQTLENNPAFVHGGPFANIAHGCNSVIATQTALKLADYVVTEAGFGADLGAEKFMNIKCRKAGLAPSAVVLVATVRAMKMNGGVAKNDLGDENVDAVKAGCSNLGRHIENLKSFGVPVVVAINHFVKDTDAEVAAVQEFVASQGAEAIVSKHWADGSEGSRELATRVAEIADADMANFAPLYADDMSLADKIQTVCKRIYRADEALMDKKIRDQLRLWEEQGYGHLPVCMAKTQYSFSTDPNLRGAPDNHSVPVREVRLSAGAGFIVAVCGEIMTMPGLPRTPAAETIRLNEEGLIEGLFQKSQRGANIRALSLFRNELHSHLRGTDERTDNRWQGICGQSPRPSCTTCHPYQRRKRYHTWIGRCAGGGRSCKPSLRAFKRQTNRRSGYEFL